MEIEQIKTPWELLLNQAKIFRLFKDYLERMPGLKIEPKKLLLNYTKNLFHPDHLFFLFHNPDGFLGGKILSNSTIKIFDICDIYWPRGGGNLVETIDKIGSNLGVNEVWGQIEEKIYRVYRRLVKDENKLTRQLTVRYIIDENLQ